MLVFKTIVLVSCLIVKDEAFVFRSGGSFGNVTC